MFGKTFFTTLLSFCVLLDIHTAENLVPDGECEDPELKNFSKNARHSTENPHSGKGCIKLSNVNTFLYSSPVEIKPDHKYRLSVFMRSGDAAKPGNTFFGLESYDKNRKKINPLSVKTRNGTLTEITADAKQGDTAVQVADTSRWEPRTWLPLVAFAKEDSSDLPNANIESGVKEIKGNSIILQKPLTRDLPKGTKIRQHLGGPQYCGAFSVKPPAEWKEYSCILNGRALVLNQGNDSHVFWPGTCYVRLLIAANVGSKNGSVLYVDDLSLTDLGPVSAVKAPVSQAKPMVELNRSSARYQCGEKAVFKCSFAKFPKGTATVFLTRDGAKNILSKEFDLAKEKIFSAEATLDRPGFLRCRIVVKDNGKQIFSEIPAAAAFEPEKIKPGAPAPDDLLKFWNDARAKLDKEVPMNVQLAKINGNSNYLYYSVSVANFGGTRTYGFLTVPAKPGKYPLLAMIPPAGAGQWNASGFPGVMNLVINVFHEDKINQEGRYSRLNRKNWYFYQGAEKPETYFYYKSILGVARMLDYATSRPEWNGILVMNGRSQGGGFALIMGGLYPKVSAVSADVPALCDHHAASDDRTPGWPQLLSKIPSATRTASYFDAANFAAYIQCPVIVSVGFIDTMCTPGSVYAAFNNIPAKEKKIFDGIKTGHGWGAVMHDFLAYREKWLKQQLKVK